jgi:hypothetical protein
MMETSVLIVFLAEEIPCMRVKALWSKSLVCTDLGQNQVVIFVYVELLFNVESWNIV